MTPLLLIIGLLILAGLIYVLVVINSNRERIEYLEDWCRDLQRRVDLPEDSSKWRPGLS